MERPHTEHTRIVKNIAKLGYQGSGLRDEVARQLNVEYWRTRKMVSKLQRKAVIN